MYTIYRIRNKVNGKSYIGYTIQDPAEKRLRDHQSNARCGKDTHLYNAMRKHRFENFSFEVLCWGENHEMGMNVAEPLIIELFAHEYNMTKGGHGTIGLCEESRKKLSAALTGKKRSIESIQVQVIAQTGMKRTPEHCEHIGASHRGMKYSPAACRNMSESHKGVKLSPSHREALSVSMLGKNKAPKSHEHKIALSKSLKGRKIGPPSLEHRRKLSVSAKKAHKRKKLCHQ